LLAATAHAPLRTRPRGSEIRRDEGGGERALAGRDGPALPRREGAPARRPAPRRGQVAVRPRTHAAGLASSALSFAAALAAGATGCTSGPRLHSADLTLVAERTGEGRASVTALALDDEGKHLFVG